MRPKVVVVVVVLAVGLLGIILLASRAFRPEPASVPSGGANVSKPESVADKRPEPAAPGNPPVSASTNIAGTNQPAVSDAAHEKYIRQRTAELDALAMKSDAASRDAILAELQNPDRAIRKAALEAAIQFGDRAVTVPRLQEIAAQTEDPAEKAEILEAIDYINLPSLTEYLAAQKGRKAALGSADAPSPSPTNRPPRRPFRRNPAPQPAPGQ